MLCEISDFTKKPLRFKDLTSGYALKVQRACYFVIAIAARELGIMAMVQLFDWSI